MKEQKFKPGEVVFSEGHGVPMGRLAGIAGEFKNLGWSVISMSHCGFETVTTLASPKPQNIPLFSFLFEITAGPDGIVKYPEFKL